MVRGGDMNSGIYQMYFLFILSEQSEAINMNKCCEWCGKELLNTRSPKRKYCDDVCRAKARVNRSSLTGTNLVVCPTCNKSFRTYRDNKSYCSDECRKNRKQSKRNIPKMVKITIVNHCDECGKEHHTTSKAQRFCSYKCKTRNRNKLNELERRKYYDAGDNSITLTKLIDKENNICYICLGECDSKDYIKDDKGTIICGNNYPSIEHVIPLSKGGKHEWGNVKLAHRGCNIRK